MYTVFVETTFSASHQLRMPNGRTEDLHFHEWRVVTAVTSRKLDKQGLAMDFQELEGLLEELVGGLKDRNLEECNPFQQGHVSAEAVAKYLFDGLGLRLPPGRQLAWVEVTEAPGCRVRYSPETGFPAGPG